MAERVPIAPRKINGKIVYSHDQRMRKLSKKKTALWQTFRSTPLRRANRRAHLKEQLVEVRKQMRRRIVQLNSERVQTIAAELEKNSGNRQMYEYARIMQKREYRPPYFRDNEGFMESDPAKIEPMVTETYTRFFNQQGKQPTAQWEGIARPLEQQISADEIRAAIARLRNHRATGPDERTAEEFKYGGETVVTELEIIFNTMFETHSTLPELTTGFLLAMPKPNKDRTVDNTRPLTLLNTIRKILSTILLNRMRAKILAYVSLSQLGYLPNRSTTEAVWSLQWIRAMVERYQERYWLLGLDLSKAFDSLDREELLRIFRDEVGATEDEMRILRTLLADTSLRTRIGKMTGQSFATTIGTPQGDALSPCLFLVYFEFVMRTLDHRFPPRQEPADMRIQYADDTHAAFIDKRPPSEIIPGPCPPACTCPRCYAEYITENLPGVMAELNMQMNADKTERHMLDRENRDAQDFKQLGTNINQDIEVAARIWKARGAMRAYHKIWLSKNPTSLRTKMKLFNSTVRPHIVQNLHAVPIRRAQADKLDVLHRQFIRRVAGIFWPRRAGNTETYKLGECLPISVEIIKLWWRFLGHILRLPNGVPAKKAMQLYYTERFQGTVAIRRKHRGHAFTSLPSLLAEEFALLKGRRFELTGGALRGIGEFTTREHLQKLTVVAADRQKWRVLADAVADGALRRWRARENRRQHIRDGEEDAEIDPDDEGDIQAQMTPAPRGRRAR